MQQFAPDSRLKIVLRLADAIRMARSPKTPRWAVPVQVPFLTLVLSGACTPKQASLLCRGALVSPFRQSVMLNDVRAWRVRQAIRRQFVLDVVTLPFALWRTL
ncbi:MAG: hypothetical protein ACR2JB_04400 [Bryobacteraceae bacterium]